MQFTTFLAIGMPGPMEWVIILAIALLLFGRRLPEVMRGLGGGVREFRKGIDGEESNPPAQSQSEQSKSTPPAPTADQPTADSEPAEEKTAGKP